MIHRCPISHGNLVMVSISQPSMFKLLFLATLVSLILCPSSIASADANDDFDEWLQKDWQAYLEAHPEFATTMGYEGFESRWEDLSESFIEAQKKQTDRKLDELAEFDRGDLSEDRKLSYDIRKFQLELDQTGAKYPSELLRMTQMYGFHTDAIAHLRQVPKKNLIDYEHLLTKYQTLPQHLEANIALLRIGIKTRVMPAKSALSGVAQQIKSLMAPSPTHPLLEAFQSDRFPASIPLDQRHALTARAEALLTKSILPAYARLYQFYTTEYLPKARDQISAAALPNGKAWYAYAVKANTTLPLSPEDIHTTGLKEVARIEGLMKNLVASTGFKGSLHEFFHYLKTDQQFFYTSRDELLQGYMIIAKTIDPYLVELFQNLPALPYGVKPIPAYVEEKATTAYYQPGSIDAAQAGIFYANTFDLPNRPKWSMPALTLHEAVPGHHLQISLAQELKHLPEFRKHTSFTAFVEGWALYAESLGTPMGLYDNKYALFGRLNYEMWRAIRLVVDTGIHAKGWSKKQAIEYFRAHSALTETNINVEVDRYIGWPAQALGYKIGELTIQHLRAQAEQALGSKFDIRAFHDAILKNGAVPLGIMERSVTTSLGLSPKP